MHNIKYMLRRLRKYTTVQVITLVVNMISIHDGIAHRTLFWYFKALQKKCPPIETFLFLNLEEISFCLRRKILFY